MQIKCPLLTAERSEVEALVATLVDALEDVEHALAKLDEYAECLGFNPALDLQIKISDG